MRNAPAALGVLLALAACPLAACQVATDFELRPVAEISDELCGDGRDDDFDGLTDCQDWECLGRLPCCDIPEILLEDDFEGGPASCDVPACTEALCTETACGPDDERWHTWPCPFAKACGGELRLDKGSCYPAGVLSRTTAALGPGLLVTVDVTGQPERLGHLEAALTLQTESDFPGALDECARLQEVDGFASARVVWAEAGVQVVAMFRGDEAGRSPVVAVGPHRLVLGVDRDRRVTYALDGEVFATADVPIPTGETQVRVALTGLTESAAFEAVRVEAGIRCHDPASFVARGGTAETAVVLAGDAAGPSAWDSDEVYYPAIHDTGDGLEVFYTGCRWPQDAPMCGSFGVAIGRATFAGGPSQPLVRDPDENPWIDAEDVTTAGVLLNAINPEMAVGLLETPARAGYISMFGYSESMVGLDDAMDSTGAVLGPNDRDAWDGLITTGPSAVDGPDGVRRLYYGGLARGLDAIWRIGLATSTDGATFTRAQPDPIFGEGAAEAFDGGGVSAPSVIYDETRQLYRMWYEGRDFFGVIAIGYAVSTDGATWSRYPGNPIVTAAQLGLQSIGGPSVYRAPDGRLLMLVHGTTIGEPRRRIFALENAGEVVAP